eukprot:gnl/Chilomastix_caulleri/5186.p1 GENE.gnl/Chilomastix_caulleri/5186~~gnl/Chilomastix_caulleri/5186.p1  ORF type:complete len:109 (+),score=22.49 gnl/Chilomastix_caulleri/5186:19-345(+)
MNIKNEKQDIQSLQALIEELESLQFVSNGSSPFKDWGARYIVYKECNSIRGDVVVDEADIIIGQIIVGGYSLAAGRGAGIVLLRPESCGFSGRCVIRRNGNHITEATI